MAAKILVVDDDPNVQRLLTYTLKQEGYEVIVAGDGAEGFRLWGTESPALMLLDVMLPKLDGYQVAAKIRTEEGTTAHVPIIMLTAEREVEQKVRGLRAGADDYLIKPFHPAELLARIKSLLARFAPAETLVGRPPLGRILVFYGAKGGVGTTTIAINTAIALHRELGRKAVLVDGNLQFGDHRVFLDLGLDRKSIVDVVTAPTIDVDLIKQVLVKHDAGIDLLLAPPSPETAELVTQPGDDRQPGVRAEQGPAGPQPLQCVHRHQRPERRGRAQADDRSPGGQRVPRRDQRPQQRRAVHVHQGGLVARKVPAGLRPLGRQAPVPPQPSPGTGSPLTVGLWLFGALIRSSANVPGKSQVSARV